MKIACVSTYDARSPNAFGGRGYYQAQSLAKQSVEIEYVGPLSRLFYPPSRALFYPLFIAKKFFYGSLNQRYTSERERILLKYYALEISRRLSKLEVDLIFSPVSPASQPIAYLDSDIPIVIWTDATFKGYFDAFKDYHPLFGKLCKESIRNGILNEKAALSRCSLVVYSSEWAAKTAIENYHIDASKVKVVPFGPYLECDNDIHNIMNMVNSRPQDKCRLLFVGGNWYIKGGDIAVEVAKELNRKGLKTVLTVVGCNPLINEPLPKFVKCLGWIRKSTREGLNKLTRLLAESHFLIVPSRSEAFGVVFCEASAFGLPSIATKVGGIPTAIRDDVNGKTFSRDASIEDYCKYILDLFSNYSQYKKLALSSFREYQSRLNWSVAGQTVKRLMIDLVR